MMVSVQFWSYLADLAATRTWEVELTTGSTVGTLLDQIYLRFPQLLPMRSSTLVALGVEYAQVTDNLVPGSVISLFPPVQGG